MSLIANGVRTTCNPMFQLAAPQAGTQTISGRQNAGSRRNFDAGEATVVHISCGIEVYPDYTSFVVDKNLKDGLEVTLTTTGTLPAPFVEGAAYRVIRLGPEDIMLAESVPDYMSDNALYPEDDGIGTHTLHAYVCQSNKAGLPNGYEPPAAWRLPTRGGGLSAYCTVVSDSAMLGEALPVKAKSIPVSQISVTVQPVGAGKSLPIAATLASNSVITATAAAYARMASTIPNACAITAPMGLRAYVLADIQSPSEVSASFVGKARAEATLTSTGDTLNTANVGDAVWAKVLEAGYSAEEILRLLASVSIGKSHGFSGGAGSGAFRDLSDSKDRVSADVDQYGNRSNITLNPS